MEKQFNKFKNQEQVDYRGQDFTFPLLNVCQEVGAEKKNIIVTPKLIKLINTLYNTNYMLAK